MSVVNRRPDLVEKVAEILAEETKLLLQQYGFDISPYAIMNGAQATLGYTVYITVDQPIRSGAGQFIPDIWPTDTLLRGAIRHCLGEIDKTIGQALNAIGNGIKGQR